MFYTGLSMTKSAARARLLHENVFAFGGRGTQPIFRHYVARSLADASTSWWVRICSVAKLLL